MVRGEWWAAHPTRYGFPKIMANDSWSSKSMKIYLIFLDLVFFDMGVGKGLHLL